MSCGIKEFSNVLGDHDAILVLLMVPRIISKADLLATQVREKVGFADIVTKAL